MSIFKFASFALFCLAIAAFGVVGGASAQAGGRQGVLAAVFPPWWPAARDLSAAARAGDILDGGAVPFVLIVGSSQPGLDARLRAAGALLLLNPLGAGGCGRPSTEKQDV